MKILAGLIRLFEASSASDRTICEAHTYNSPLQLEANNLGHCAVYEKELQRVWPITEENRKAKIAAFGKKHGFRLAYYKQGHCAIFLEESTGYDATTQKNPGDVYANWSQSNQPFG